MIKISVDDGFNGASFVPPAAALVLIWFVTFICSFLPLCLENWVRLTLKSSDAGWCLLVAFGMPLIATKKAKRLLVEPSLILYWQGANEKIGETGSSLYLLFPQLLLYPVAQR